MVPLYVARIEDLGPGDLVKVDCAGCCQPQAAARAGSHMTRRWREEDFEPPVPLANELSLRRNERCRESEKASLGSVSYLSGHRTFEPGFLRQRG